MQKLLWDYEQSTPQCFEIYFLDNISCQCSIQGAELLLSDYCNSKAKFCIPAHLFPVPLIQDSLVSACNHQGRELKCGCVGNGGHILHELKANSSPLLLWLENNSPPRAHAGGKHVLVLPNNSVTLDGSRSADDQGIVSYLWIRDGQSPAAGVSFFEGFNWIRIQL